MEKQISLDQATRSAIWNAITSKMRSDDRNPQDVINEDYNGDTDSYLRAMARWHNIAI